MPGVSTKMRSATRLVLAIFVLGPQMGFGQNEPQGLLIYQQPATTYTEALEYRTFRQDNALYATVVTSTGERKQLKAGGVLAALPYPPASFDSSFASAAQTSITKIEALEGKYPAVKPQLQQTREKWTRALDAFNQLPKKPVTKPAGDEPAALLIGGNTLKNARITSATPERVTFMHDSGVMTLPIAELTAAQVLALNRNSDKLQLPLGIAPSVARPTGQATEEEEDTLTLRVAATGNDAVTFCATKMGITSAAFSAWAFFVVGPLAVLLLLLGLIFFARQSTRVTRLKSK